MIPTSTTQPIRRTGLQEVRNRLDYLTQFAEQPTVRPVILALLTTPQGLALAAILSALPVLCDEIERLRDERTAHHNLTAAALATLAADRDGEPDPLYYVRDELSAQRGEAP
ncbi:hypothetical protein [Herbidospora sp. NBRC 101105]|uniref:hypothetical protein n=1 Tax=Herbidospora sp. NBRC 101105 TaxID=3032195 RepID=UPI0024A2FC30|nr:hypothetical protein [Herbidospora sp. NBRC 101105]GLX98753.1 hypothetical protein Hesp01_67030 [Herbidospora sp. NBRC 101105]